MRSPRGAGSPRPRSSRRRLMWAISRARSDVVWRSRPSRRRACHALEGGLRGATDVDGMRSRGAGSIRPARNRRTRRDGRRALLSRASHDRDHLVGATAAPPERLLEEIELLLHPAHADPERNAVPGEHRRRPDGLRDDEGIPEREHVHVGEEAKTRGHRCHRRDEHPGIRPGSLRAEARRSVRGVGIGERMVSGGRRDRRP